MKRIKYNCYFTADEHERIDKYAAKNRRSFSEFVCHCALAEVGRHAKEKSVYKRLEALEQAIKQIGI